MDFKIDINATDPWAKDTWCFDELPSDKVQHVTAQYLIPMTNENITVMHHLLPLWIQCVKKWTRHPKEKKRLTEWRSAVTDIVLKHTSFKCFIDDDDWDLGRKKQAHREYSKVVAKFFKNYKNCALDKTSSVKPTPSSQTRVKTDHASLVSGQKIFEESNAAAIQMRTAELLSTGAVKNDNHGGTNHKAISQLWNELSDANHDQYNELALHTKNNRLMLRKELPGLFLDLLKETEELLGPTAFTLCYAFQDEVNGINPGILNVCTNGIEKLSDAFSENAQDSLMAWAEVNHARNSNHFDKNSEGVPCFPPVDLDNTTLLQLKVLVDKFFFTLWAYVQCQESEVPYAELIKSPGGFYNMSKWQSMPLLTCAPKDMSHVQIIGLVEYLKSHSGAGVDDPFVFWKHWLPPPPAWSLTPLIATHSPLPPPPPAWSPTLPIPTHSPSPPPPPARSPTPPIPPRPPILSLPPPPPLSPPIPPHSPPILPPPVSPPIPSHSLIAPPASKCAWRALATNNDSPQRSSRNQPPPGPQTRNKGK